MAALAEADKRELRIHAYSEDLRKRAARRVELERDLRRAIEAREFELHYQPKSRPRPSAWSAPKRCCAGGIR